MAKQPVSKEKTAENTPEKKTAATPAVPSQRALQTSFDDLRSEVDELFRRFSHSMAHRPFGFGLSWDRDPFEGLGFPFRFSADEPAVDVSENKKGYEISVDLPGMAEEDLNLTLTDQTLTLAGEKKSEREEEEKDYHLKERRVGSFRRSFRLPDDVDAKKVTADFKNGVLTVKLPKSAAAKKREQKIKIASKPA